MATLRWVPWYVGGLIGAIAAFVALRAVTECTGQCNIGGDLLLVPVACIPLTAGSCLAIRAHERAPAAGRAVRFLVRALLWVSLVPGAFGLFLVWSLLPT